jgi:L-threonylcarbamoyladenylate synthase
MCGNTTTGIPIAAPSANSSGRPSPTTANHVYTDLKGRIPCIVDGGDAMVGVESTVLDMRSDPPVILRPGGITQEQLTKYLPDVRVYGKEGVARSAELEAAPPTPGLKYRHYSPTARVVLIEWTVVDPVGELVRGITKSHGEKQRVGLIRTTGHGSELPFTLVPFEEGNSNSSTTKEGEVLVYSLGEGERGDSEKFAAVVANGLFKALRALDGSGVDIIYVEGIDETHAGLAVMNRLRKAASEIIS